MKTYDPPYQLSYYLKSWNFPADFADVEKMVLVSHINLKNKYFI